MILITFSALLLSIFFAFGAENKSTKNNGILYNILGLILIIIASFRNGDSMPDYSTYVGLYHKIISGSFTYLIEISFIIISKIANILSEGNSVLLFTIYAILGVSLKFISIKHLTDLSFFSVIIYISNYFILQEMIQIRAGVATALILLSIKPLYERNFKYFLFLIGVAVFFHYSSFVFIFLWFLDSKNINKKLYIFLILIAYIYYFSGFDLIVEIANIIPIKFFSFKLISYTNSARIQSLAINVFGIYALTRIIILLYFLYFSNIIQKRNKYFYLFLKFYALGIFSYLAFARFPDLAVRLSYTLTACEIMIIPTLIYTIKGHYLPRFIVVLYALLAFGLNVYFTSYFTWELSIN